MSRWGGIDRANAVSVGLTLAISLGITLGVVVAIVWSFL